MNWMIISFYWRVLTVNEWYTDEKWVNFACWGLPFVVLYFGRGTAYRCSLALSLVRASHDMLRWHAVCSVHDILIIEFKLCVSVVLAGSECHAKLGAARCCHLCCHMLAARVGCIEFHSFRNMIMCLQLRERAARTCVTPFYFLENIFS